MGCTQSQELKERKRKSKGNHPPSSLDDASAANSITEKETVAATTAETQVNKGAEEKADSTTEVIQVENESEEKVAEHEKSSLSEENVEKNEACSDSNQVDIDMPKQDVEEEEKKEEETQDESSTENQEEKPLLVDKTASVKDIISRFDNSSPGKDNSKKDKKYKTAPEGLEIGQSPSIRDRQNSLMNSYKETKTSSSCKEFKRERLTEVSSEVSKRKLSSQQMKEKIELQEEINEMVNVKKSF